MNCSTTSKKITDLTCLTAAIFVCICWLPGEISGRQKVERIVGKDVALDLLYTTTVPTTTEDLLTTTLNATNETIDEFAMEEAAVLADNPDPEDLTDEGYAVAWMDLGADGYNESFTGEVRFLQVEVDGDVSVSAWFRGLNASTTYQIKIHEYGDLVWDDSCWGAGPVYKFENDTDNLFGDINYFAHNFTTPDDLEESEQYKFNFTTYRAPVWGDNSIIGRMVVLEQFFNKSYLESTNITLRYLNTFPATTDAPTTEAATSTSWSNETYENLTENSHLHMTSNYQISSESLYEDSEIPIIIGCGPIGIGNANFSVVHVSSLGLRVKPHVIHWPLLPLMYLLTTMLINALPTSILALNRCED